MIAAFLVISRLTGVSCVILYFTGVPCPACGMTRAMVALLSADVSAYVRYNAMAPFVFLAVLLEIHINRLPRRKIIHGYSITVLLLNLIYYAVRFKCGLV